MKIDSGTISGSKFMFCVICFFQASTLLLDILSEISVQDTWIVIIIGTIICIPIMLMFSAIMTSFPDRNFIQILDAVYGRVIGKILGILYIWYFITLACLSINDLSNFTKIFILPATPPIFLRTLCVLATSIAVRKGIKLVAKFSVLFVWLQIIVLIVTMVMLLNIFDIKNFLPLFSLKPMEYVHATHMFATIPVGEVVVFLMIHPSVKRSQTGIKKYLLWGFIIGCINMLIRVIRDIGVLGNTMTLFTVPSLVSLRMINAGPTISRMEILFAVVLTLLLIFKIMVLFYVSILAVAQFFKFKSYYHLVLILGALLVLYSLTLYPTVMQLITAVKNVMPFMWTLFDILLPLITLIIAKIRKLPKYKEASA